MSTRRGWDFSSDISKVSFCPECGSLLDLPLTGGVMKCLLCKYASRPNASNKTQEIVTKSKQRVVQSGRLKKEKGLDHRAKVNNLCEKCGHDEMYYSCAQLRSADEGQTTFFECCNCGDRTSINN